MDAAVVVRLPADLRDAVEKRAAHNERSLSGEVRRILRDAVEKPTAANGWPETTAALEQMR